MGTSSLPEMYAQSLRVQPEDCKHTFPVPILQLLCNTFKADSLGTNTSLTIGPFIYACLKVLIMGRQK